MSDPDNDWRPSYFKIFIVWVCFGFAIFAFITGVSYLIFGWERTSSFVGLYSVASIVFASTQLFIAGM